MVMFMVPVLYLFALHSCVRTRVSPQIGAVGIRPQDADGHCRNLHWRLPLPGCSLVCLRHLPLLLLLQMGAQLFLFIFKWFF